MARTIYGNHERFLDTYYRPYCGTYFSGDGALKDQNGYITVTGRMDDVINISGHRLGTAEIEDVMVSLILNTLRQSSRFLIFFYSKGNYKSY